MVWQSRNIITQMKHIDCSIMIFELRTYNKFLTCQYDFMDSSSHMRLKVEIDIGIQTDLVENNNRLMII